MKRKEMEIIEKAKTHDEAGVNMLLDTWELTGNTFDGLYKVLDELDKRTKFLNIMSNEFSLMTVWNIEPDGTVSTYWHKSALSWKLVSFTPDDLKKIGATPELIAEMRCDSPMFIKINNSVFFTSERVIRTLSQRAGSPIGKAAVRKELDIRLTRNAFYTAYKNDVPEVCHLVYREIGHVKKVYAALTDRHNAVSQGDNIRNIVKMFNEELGTPNLQSWMVENRETVVQIEYPDKSADFTNVQKDIGKQLPDIVVPGIYIRTADTGDSAFKVLGTIRVGNATLFVPEAKATKAHTKKTSEEAILNEVKKNVFKEYKRIPERLCELIMMDIPDPVSLIEPIAEACKVENALGGGAQKEIIAKITALFRPDIQYTAYDIAMMFLSESAVREQTHQRDDALAKVRNCFVRAVFFEYEKYLKV